MNNEKEIEEMAKVLFESGVALDATDFAFGVDGDDHFTRLAIKLVNVGFGNVKQAVQEFAEELKKRAKLLHEPNREWYENVRVNEIDDLIAELYGADE